jgi:hypothetical protein
VRRSGRRTGVVGDVHGDAGLAPHRSTQETLAAAQRVSEEDSPGRSGSGEEKRAVSPVWSPPQTQPAPVRSESTGAGGRGMKRGRETTLH